MKKQSRRAAAAMNRRALAAFAEYGRNPRCVEYRNWGDLRRTYPNEQLLDARNPSECGTTSGYRQHVRRKEKACEACKEAHRIDMAERRPSRSKAAA